VAEADELHLVVVDEAGQHTGVPGTVLERFAFVSKANNAKNANGENNYYVEVINRSQPTSGGWIFLLQPDELGKDATIRVRCRCSTGSTRQPLWVDRQTTRTSGICGLQTAYDIFKNKDKT
jgi:hypothetical protein